MANLDDQKSHLLMGDFIQYLRDKLGTEAWVVVYDLRSGSVESVSYHCGLIPESEVPEALERATWDVRVGDGRPGCIISGDESWYERIGSQEGIERLVLRREFYGCAEDYLEISEDYRLFHNLFHNVATNRYIRFDDDGNPEEVIRIENGIVRMKLKPLKQYLAIREMRLALYFEARRFSLYTLKELGLNDAAELVQDDVLTYQFYAGPNQWGDAHHKTFARLMGKKLIKGMPKERCGIWPYDEDKDYVDFIIGMDGDGEPVTYTCNPDLLANYFGANPDAPHYVTPVFFRRDVLTKYYNAPDRFSVEDGCLRSGALWILRMDNDQDGNVMVYLGDLGRDLSHQEQLYWRHYNIVPDGTQTMSETAFRRGFLAQWANPQMADLVFKSKLAQFQERWFKSFGWHLFKPLSEDDMHNLTALRVPVSEEQVEFDSQLLALAKVLADSLNVEEMNKVLPPLGDPAAREQSIAKFERFLPHKGAVGFEPHADFLRRLYQLRSKSSGHRKGSDFAKTAAKFGLDTKPLTVVFEGFLKEATDMLEYLEQAFGIAPAPGEEPQFEGDRVAAAQASSEQVPGPAAEADIASENVPRP